MPEDVARCALGSPPSWYCHASGRSVSQRLASFAGRRHYLAQLALAVQALHTHNVSHRDIKPENIVFDKSYNALLTDFGSCVCTDGGASALEQPRTMTGLFPAPDDSRMWRVGTEAYAPPESYTGVVQGGAGYDPQKYDVWSLGVLLFLMCCIDNLEILLHNTPGARARLSAPPLPPITTRRRQHVASGLPRCRCCAERRASSRGRCCACRSKRTTTRGSPASRTHRFTGRAC